MRCLKICPVSETGYIYEKWQRRKGCTRQLTRTLPLPLGRDRKIRTGLRANQIAGGVTIPAEKKSKWICGQMKNQSITFTSIDPTLPI